MLWHSVQLIVIVLFNSFGPKYPIFNSVDDLVGLQHVHTSQMKKKKKRNIKSYGCVQFTHCHRCMASRKKNGVGAATSTRARVIRMLGLERLE